MSKRQREEESRSLNKLESENAKLKKSVSRLRRRLERYEGVATEDDEEIKEVPISDKEKCPECSSKDLTELDLGGKLFRLCKACKWRKLIKRV